ncbi:hypothetical protein [Aeromicrobium sp.]|uniref:hypothetical protein n=1 Tax=Aeromicrobium sp. TaxID=1871063 RepID=UPI003C41FB3C
MPDLPETPSSASANRSLVLAETAEAAYRYAAVDARETDILLVADDGTFSGIEPPYASVVVAGFGSDPGALGRLVDAAFSYAEIVSVGAAGSAIAGSTNEWRSAFETFRVVDVTTGAFPAVDLAREGSPDSGTGDFVRGALSVLAHWEPRPDLRARPAPTTEILARETPRKTPPSAPAPRLRKRVEQVVANHRRLVRLAAIGALGVLLVTLGLVALINQYALALLSLALMFLIGAVALRQEQRARRLQSTVDRIDAMSRTLQDMSPPIRPATLTERVHAQGKAIHALQRSVAVVELASVDSARMLERIDSALHNDSENRA